MDNYFIEDEMDAYQFNYDRAPVNKTKIILIIVGVIIGIIVIVVALKIINGQKYSSLEKNMVSKATQYINNSSNTNKEVYIDISKLNIEVPSNCNLLSGVFYKNNKYTPYLLCDDYESKIEDENKEIVLNGKSIILLPKGNSYYELGTSGSEPVQISGSVNTLEEGVYSIYYIPSSGKSYGVRKVVIVDNPSVNNYLPVITYEDNIELVIGQGYNNPVSVLDRFDGDITNKMIKIDNSNIYESGEYRNIYYAINSLGYTKIAMQKVVVYNDLETNVFAELSDDNMTNNSIYITIKIMGDKYSKMILPNGDETIEKEYSYEVLENGEYEFIAVNEDDSRVSKIVKITNIDKTVPEGTCTATLYNDKTVFNVNMSSFNHIVGYNYLINNMESGYLTDNTYTTSKATSNNLSVLVRDYIGNETTLSCVVNDNTANFDPNGYRVVIRDKPRMHIPIADALGKRGYTISDLNACIYNRVQDAGPYTRWGVAAAAFGLIDCTYSMTGTVLPYNHTSGKVNVDADANYCTFNSDICGKLGVNSRWGSKGGTCSTDTTKQCYHGLNCATFVRWSMCNGGMDLCSRGAASAFAMTNKQYFPEADGVYVKSGKVSYYTGRNFSSYSAEQVFRMIKPGDIMATSEGGGHTFVIVGIDNNGIYTAEDGYFMRYLKFSQLVSSNENHLILYLDNYFANSKNRNNLYG